MAQFVGRPQPPEVGVALFVLVLAEAGRLDEALRYLAQAIDHGYKNPEEMAADDTLKSLHGDARFEALVARAKERAVAAQRLR